MITGMVLIKGVAAASCLIGAAAVYRSFPEPAVRRKLMQVFKAGEICIKRKGLKGKEIRKYPQSLKVTLFTDRIRAPFLVPVGIDPKDVHKHLWLFKQVFGPEIELEGDMRNFTLTIFPSKLKPFPYDFETIKQHIEKMHLGIFGGMSRWGVEAYDMIDHPHLLITGETGSGKSTQLRSILATLIKAYSADKLHLYLADLKQSEFHLFERVEHVKANVVKTAHVEKMLNQIHKEMERRGELLHKEEVAHIDDLKVKLPYIVVCIDEFALLKKEKDIMDLMEEISSIGRALGVFLILSCLRPDAEVMDGKLKNNLTVRMAFKTSDGVNSRITLGSDEASYIKESEKGKFYMKYNGLRPVQAPNLELEAAKKLLEPYKTLKKHDNISKTNVIDIEHAVVEDVWGALDEETGSCNPI